VTNVPSQIDGRSVSVSRPSLLVLHPPPSWHSSSVVGVFAVGPVKPIEPGEVFNCSIYAQAGDNVLDGFAFRMTYDESAAHLTSITPAGHFLYASPFSAG
jgi:hypothetical protein